MKKLIALIILSLFTSPLALAKHQTEKNHKMKKEVMQQHTLKKTELQQHALKKTKLDKSNKNGNTISNMSSSIKAKGLSSDLSKKGKNLPGWTEGEKRGWEDKGFFRSVWDRFLGFFSRQP